MRGGPDLVVLFRDIIRKLLITSVIWHCNVLADDPIFHTVTEMYTSPLTYFHIHPVTLAANDFVKEN